VGELGLLLVADWRTSDEGTKNGPLGPARDTTVVMSSGRSRYVVEVSILLRLPR